MSATGSAGQATPVALDATPPARVPGESALWAWAFEGDRTASAVPVFIVRYRGIWAGEVTRLAAGHWAWTAVVDGEAESGEATGLDLALRAVAGMAVV